MKDKKTNDNFGQEKYVTNLDPVKTTSKKQFRLSIDVSSTLVIEIKSINVKIKCPLLGIKHNGYIIADLPDIIDRDTVDKCNMHLQAEVICKYVHEGSVYGFRTSLLRVISDPIKLMVIKYPVDAEECNLRRHIRAAIVLPAKIKFKIGIFSGSILDISEIGCQMAVLNTSIEQKDIKALANTDKREALLSLKLPGEEQDILMPSIYRNIRHDTVKTYIGMEFVNLDQKAELRIKMFVSEMRKYAAVD